MPFASKRMVRIWLFITVLSVVAVSFVAAEDKRFDLKIGFDITNGENGGPSLRIRDFEDASDIRQRAKDDDDKGTRPTVRAESSSAESDDKDKDKLKASRDKDSSADKSDDDDDDDSGSDDNRRSTRGLNAGDYEPEENVKVHNYRDNPSDNDSDRFRRRKRFAHYRRKEKSRKKGLRL